MASLSGISSATPPASTASPNPTSSSGPPPSSYTGGSILRNKPIKSISPSSRERVEDILDEARDRKVTMGGSNRGSEVWSSSTRRKDGGDSGAQSPLGGAGGRDTESSTDEETEILRRSRSNASSMNYQATVTSTTDQQQQRTRTPKNQPSTQSIRRDGRIHSLDADEDHEEDQAGEHEGWWAKFISEYGSIELENKGSVARDHLALERTFLAWLRTSLAFASIGIAITQLFRLNTASSSSRSGDPYLHLRQMGKPLGATFLGISIVMLFIGFHRYFESQHWIIRGKFPASRGSIVIVAGITFALMVTSLVVVVVVEPGAYEKR